MVSAVGRESAVAEAIATAMHRRDCLHIGAVKWCEQWAAEVAPAVLAALDTPPAQAEAVAALRTCDRTHGGEHNDATVYGHHASVRICIRLHDSDEWVYDPRWETNR